MTASHPKTIFALTVKKYSRFQHQEQEAKPQDFDPRHVFY